MKLILREGALTVTRSVGPKDDVIAMLDSFDSKWSRAELVDDRKVCFQQASFSRNGEGWKCVMDRSGVLGPRPDEAELALELEIDLTWALVERARRERSRHPSKLRDWPGITKHLVERGLVRRDGRLTTLGRKVAYELIDQGF